MDKNKKDEEVTEDTFLQKHIIKILFVISIVAVVLIISALLFYRIYVGTEFTHSNEIWGQFGDYFGGLLNPILSFLALIALLVTITLQSKELKLATNEMRDSSTALKEQSDSLKLQNFENTFFNLLNKHTQTISFLVVENQLKGYEVIKTCVEIISSTVEIKSRNIPYSEALYISTSEAIDNYDLGRLLNESLDLIDLVMRIESENKIDPKPYIEILKRQYSKYELMLFYSYMFLIKNESYYSFFRSHLFFTDLKKSLMHQLLENIMKYCGNPSSHNKYVDFLYLNIDEIENK